MMNYWCECSYPTADSITSKNGTCGTCGKPVRIYNQPVPSKEMTLDEALIEVQEAYPDDKIAAGIQLAWLPDKQLFYAAVHQFPGNVASRRVVAKASEATSGQAISTMLDVWRAIRAAEKG